MPTLTPELTTGGVEVGDATGWSVREGAVALLNGLALPGVKQFYHRTESGTRGLEGELSEGVGVVSKARGNFNRGADTPCGMVDNVHAFLVAVVRPSQKGLDGSRPGERQADLWLEEASDWFNGTRPNLQLPNTRWVIVSQVVDSDPRYLPAWLKQIDAAYFQVQVTVRKDMPRA